MSRPDESVTALPTGTGKLAFAEALRGLAAGLVVICHFAQVYWGDRQAVPSFSNSDILAETAYPTPWYIGWIVENPLIRNGACGVGLFFLLSGFVIQLSLKHYSMKGFVVGRFMRLYPTYIFGLSVTMMTVSVAGLIYNRPFPYLNTEVLLQYAVGLRSLIGSRSLDGIS